MKSRLFFVFGSAYVEVVYADRFGRAEYWEESAGPVELSLYLIVIVGLFIHEKSPLHEWASDNKFLSWGIFVVLLPVLYRMSPEFAVGIFTFSALAFTLLTVFWPKKEPQSNLEPVTTESSNPVATQKTLAALTDQRDDPFFIDRAIEYAYAYDANELRHAVKAIARRIHKKHPGQYPPLKSWLDENGEVLSWCEKDTNFYDMFLDYVIDYGYPNSLTDDHMTRLSNVVSNIKSKMVSFFPEFIQLDEEDIQLSVVGTAIFRAIHILDNKNSAEGVSLTFKPIKKKTGFGLPTNVPRIDF